MQGGGIRGAGTTLSIPIRGRAEVGGDAAAVVLNVTVTQPQDRGFATIYPCDAARPTASNLNFMPGQTIPNLVIATIGAAGDVCLFTTAAAHYVVDVAGYFPTGAYLGLSAPQRLLDTRAGGPTADGVMSGVGAVAAGTVLTLPVAGRVGIASDAESVVLNVTATEPQSPGFATIYPCGVTRPTASNLNFDGGETIPNAVVAKLAPDGTVCLYSHATAHFVVDAAGVMPSSTFQPLSSPQRLLETRAGEPTSDGQQQGIGMRSVGTSTRVQVAGRAGVPDTAAAVILNVTVTQPNGSGFTTVFPMGASRPTASNLNYVAGDTIPNAVVARIGAGGSICLFTQTAAHYIIDVAGYLTGALPPGGSGDCPAPVVPPTTTTPPPPTTTTPPSSNCHPSYPTHCIPPPPPDLDCGEIPWRDFTVLPPDPHGFDRDHDGIGCES